jgi:hypothetical protein
MSVHVRSCPFKSCHLWTERGHTITTSSIVSLRNNKQPNGVENVDGEVEGGVGLGNKGEEAEEEAGTQKETYIKNRRVNNGRRR